MIYENADATKIWIEICCSNCNRTKPIIKNACICSYCSRHRCIVDDDNCCIGWRPKKKMVVKIVQKNRSKVKADDSKVVNHKIQNREDSYDANRKNKGRKRSS